MTGHDELFAALAAPFPDTDVRVRPGAKNRDKTKALALHYIDARAVQERLDATVGPMGWEDRYEMIDPQRIGFQCYLTLTIDGQNVRKTGVGYPNQEGDEEPGKGAESDALKRAAVKFGVGRYLYALPREWRPWDEQRDTWAEASPTRPAQDSLPQQAREATAAQQAGPSAANAGAVMARWKAIDQEFYRNKIGGYFWRQDEELVQQVEWAVDTFGPERVLAALEAVTKDARSGALKPLPGHKTCSPIKVMLSRLEKDGVSPIEQEAAAMTAELPFEQPA